MKHLFPSYKNTHPMLKIKQEYLKVFHANTDRLKNSSIIYMEKTNKPGGLEKDPRRGPLEELISIPL